MPVQAPPTKRTVLRDLIDERGLKYGFVAGKLSLSPSLLTRLLARERTLSASELIALTELLGVPASAFFDGNELLLSCDASTNNELSPAGVQATERGQRVESEGNANAEGVYPLDAADAGLVPPAVESEGTRGE